MIRTQVDHSDGILGFDFAISSPFSSFPPEKVHISIVRARQCEGCPGRNVRLEIPTFCLRILESGGRLSTVADAGKKVIKKNAIAHFFIIRLFVVSVLGDNTSGTATGSMSCL